jgi:hypothetical protein
LSSKTRTNSKSEKFRRETIFAKIQSDHKSTKIPTTFVPLAPERISFGPRGVDILSGVFHIMWQDMPNPRSYGIRLTDNFSLVGEYLGCILVCTFPREKSISC